ncbi:hypothetical protein [Planococcus notacanthi]|uniref:Uncharacterized protein n=1 Tax=Planococcus notacanthi TaxID=3035188 RepID=A0ABT7ZJW0_9BACL|nr:MULTISPECIES: hypothetical protein [Terrabacteria group]MDN3427445.1 hypothetical protein [Planococcus sp. APC 4016]
MIKELKDYGADNIAVLDYDYLGDYEERRGATYISASYAPFYIKKFDSVNYYKSMYIYPGMSNSIASHLKKEEE